MVSENQNFIVKKLEKIWVLNLPRPAILEKIRYFLTTTARDKSKMAPKIKNLGIISDNIT